MSKQDARAFEEKLLTIDLIDSLRREQERLDAALGDAERMQVLRTEIQNYYAQAGISVSEALIDQAIAERQAQRLAFRPPALNPFGKLAASAWVYRKRVAAVLLLLVTAGGTGWFAEYQYDLWQQQRAVAAYRDQLQQQLDALNANQSAIAALPAELPGLSSSQIPALSLWMDELQTVYTQNLQVLNELRECDLTTLPEDLTLHWSGEAELNRCHARLDAAQTALARVQQLQEEHRQLAAAVESHRIWQQRRDINPMLEEWNIITSANNEVRSAAASGTSSQFATVMARATVILNELATALDTHTEASSCLSRAITAGGSGADQAALGGLLAEGQTFKRASTLDGLGNWSARAADTCTFFNEALQLRIVSERGEQTGVWRYYDGNRGARSYYLVVDAVSPGGRRSFALFNSAENNEYYKRDRFAVRVSEELFNDVRKDKQDDGILRNNTLGEKPANSLTWQLAPGAAPSFIAEW